MSAAYDAAMQRLQEVLDAPVVRDVPTKEMLLTKATTIAATERGEFTAVISTERTDREGDVVLSSAMVNALRAWGANGKKIPFAWAHRTEPDELIGHIDPSTVKAVNGEVIADGWIDRTIPRGQQVWRLVKSDTLGFSFGYLIVDAVKRDDGTREIRALDIFEVSATATPMNGDTRVVSWKSTEPEPEPPSLEQLREHERRLGLEDPEIARIRREMADQIRIHMNADAKRNGNGKTLTAAELRAKADRIAAEHAPIRVESFPC
jgi:HK97 family phage prohead protease